MDSDESLFIAIGNRLCIEIISKNDHPYNKACVEELIEKEQRLFDRNAKGKVDMNHGRWALDRRLDGIWRISFGMSFPLPTTILEPRDFLSKIDSLPDSLLFTSHLQFRIVSEIQAERKQGFNHPIQEKLESLASATFNTKLKKQPNLDLAIVSNFVRKF